MGQSLLEVLRNVAMDAGERSAFESDPAGYLDQHGYGDVPLSDLQEAVGLVADTLPPDVARTVAPGATDDASGSSLVETLQRLEGNGGPAGGHGADPADGTGGDLTTPFGNADFDNGVVAAGGTGADGSPAQDDGGDGAGDGPRDGPGGHGAPSEGDHGDDAVAFGTGSTPSARAEPDAPSTGDSDGGDRDLSFDSFDDVAAGPGADLDSPDSTAGHDAGLDEPAGPDDHPDDDFDTFDGNFGEDPGTGDLDTSDQFEPGEDAEGSPADVPPDADDLDIGAF